MPIVFPGTGNLRVGVVDDGICMAYGTRKVREVLKKESLPQIAGGIQGISLLGSAYEGDMVSLEAVFLYHMPADIFRSFPVRIKAEGAAMSLGRLQRREIWNR